MADVFISYSHKDSDYAQRLADELKRRHIDVWIDQRLDYGDQWPRVIEENLASCCVFIVLMSANARNSTWVQNEVSYAQNHQKPIFPLLLEGNLWLSTASLQYVDVRNGELPPEKFFERVRRQMDASARHPPHLQPDSPPVKPIEIMAQPHKRRWGLYIAAPVVLCIALSGFLFLAWWTKGAFTASPTAEPGSSAFTKPPASGAPVIETPMTPESDATLLYNTGIITFIASAEDSQSLLMLDQNGNPRQLLKEPGIKGLRVLCVSPLTSEATATRYLAVRYFKDGAYYAIVLDAANASSIPIAQGVEAVQATYLQDGRLLVEVKIGDTAIYKIHDTNGSNPTEIFTTLLSLPTSTPLPTSSSQATP